MATTKTYTTTFTKADLDSEQNLIHTYIGGLLIPNPLYAVIQYQVSNMPSFVIGLRKNSDAQVTVNCSECPSGTHVISIIYKS